MVTTIILSIFAICYYLFCVFLSISYIEDSIFMERWHIKMFSLMANMIIAPIAVPIMLGIYIGTKWKNEL